MGFERKLMGNCRKEMRRDSVASDSCEKTDKHAIRYARPRHFVRDIKHVQMHMKGFATVRSNMSQICTTVNQKTSQLHQSSSPCNICESIVS